jgi:TldD protein
MIDSLNQYKNSFKYYTELRVQENRNFRLGLLNGNLVTNDQSVESGVSSRVFKDGDWGFSSNAEINDNSIGKVIKSSSENAFFLNDRNPNKCGILLPEDIFNYELDLTTKRNKNSNSFWISFIEDLDNYIVNKYKNVSSRKIFISNLDMEKNLLTSAGTESYSMTPRSLLYIVLTVEKNNEPVELMDVFGGLGQLEDNFDNVETYYPKIDELVDKLVQKSVGVHAKAGYHNVVLDADLAGILAHEAIGHTTEADLVMGGSVAGDYLNKSVASDLVTLVDYANTNNNKICPVPVYVDDEGTKAKDVTIIENGILKSYMHNKDSAHELNMNITGNARAYRYSDEPLIRMRNTAIKPGQNKINDMIASIDDGYYLTRSSNGQADSTSEFMFGVVMGYEIKNGKINQAIKDTTISGIAFDVLKTVTMISDEMVWSSGGMCGKKQLIPVGMGGPAIKCKLNIGGR